MTVRTFLHNLADSIGLAVVAALLAALLALGIGIGPGLYLEEGQSPNDAPVTPATEWHGLPGNNAGFSDQAKGAAPAGAGNSGGDGGIHGIANNPGQSGNSPADQGNPSCNMHGGFNGTKSQCP